MPGSALEALQKLYEESTVFPRAVRGHHGRNADSGALPRVLSASQASPPPATPRSIRGSRSAMSPSRAIMRPRSPGRICSRNYLHPADRAADPEPRHAGPDRHLRTRRSRCISPWREGAHVEGSIAGPAAPAAARPVRRAGPQHHRRPYRQRHAAAAIPAGRGRWRRSPRSASTIRWHGWRTTPRPAPTHFQNHVLFTNYQFYMDEFVRVCPRGCWPTRRRATTAFVEPGNVVTTGERAHRRRRPARHAADAGLST